MSLANAVDNKIVGITDPTIVLLSGRLLEIVTAASASAGVTATTGQNLNIASVALSIGYWLVWGNFYFSSTSGTANAYGWVSQTSATYPSNTIVTCIPGANTPIAAGPVPMWIMPFVSAPTTLYLSGQANFSGTGTYYGNVFAGRYA